MKMIVPGCKSFGSLSKGSQNQNHIELIPKPSSQEQEMSARMEDTMVEPIQNDVQCTTNAMTSAADSQGGRFFFALNSVNKKRERDNRPQ